MAKNYIVPDNMFDSLQWNDASIQDLASKLLGSQIIGLEPVTDGSANTGAIIYVERRSGELLAVELFWDYEELIMATATVPKRRGSGEISNKQIVSKDEPQQPCNKKQHVKQVRNR